MAKWADYLINEVRYNSAHSHIVKVRALIDNGVNIGTTPIEFSRIDAIRELKRGTSFETIFKNAEGKWNRGERVYIIKVNGEDFIKTVDNGKPADNLENLPEF